jgi:DNA invertase Pin-like site-specific DNA recombinase
MKSAFSYIRWSTKSQGDEGRDSRERQTKSAAKWMAEHSNGEYVLSNERFVDSGKSASKGKNIEKDAQGRAKGELQRFIQCVEEGKIKKGSILLIDEYSRFSRLPTAESLALFSQVISSGIGLVFTSSHEKRVINSELLKKEPHILFFIIGEMIRSYTETAERSRKIISAKAKKRADMIAGNVVPHSNVPKYFSYIPITQTNGKYVHNENTEIVKELVNRILAGNSLYSIADDLNGRKVKTFRRGYQWSGNSIRQILRNRALIGEYLGVKNFVEPIIDESIFNRIQVILNQNVRSRGKKGELVNIFRGICYCAYCNHTMAVQKQSVGENTHRYLRCSVGGIGKNVSCKNKKHIRLGAMETEFFNHFLNKHPYELINDDERAELKELNKHISSNQLKLDKLNVSIEKLVALSADIELEELKARLVKSNNERDTIKAGLDNLTSKVTLIQDAPENIRPVLATEIDLNTGKTISVTYADTFEKVEQALKDNAARERTRLMLPSLIGKITVDCNKGQFYVYNRLGKLIFESHPQMSLRNRSQKWKDSLKNWTTRRTASGRVIPCKRYKRKAKLIKAQS